MEKLYKDFISKRKKNISGSIFFPFLFAVLILTILQLFPFQNLRALKHNHSELSSPGASVTLSLHKSTAYTGYSISVRNIKKVQIEVTWNGIISSDWLDAQNWYGGIPTGATNVTIPYSQNPPVLSTGSGSVRDITIQNGASIIVSGGKLLVSGIITNYGTFDATSGTVEFNGTVAQNISGKIFVGNTLFNLTVSNPFGLTVSNVSGDSLNITGELAFGNIAGAILKTGDNIVLRSTAFTTARVAPIPVDGTGVATCFINGNVTVERFMPSNRKWHLLTSPVSNTGSIYNSWQNKGVYDIGKGMLITGPAPTIINGLDASPQNASSIKTYNSETNSYINVTDTKISNLSNSSVSAANIGYFTFVRGDRNLNNLIVGYTNPTTLSCKGQLQTGSQTFPLISTASLLTMIGNPYASPVDLAKIVRNNVVNRYYYWDPNLSSLGAYVVFEDLLNIGTYQLTPPISGLTQILQPGQAFLAQTAANGPASMVFQESGKSTANNLIAFRPFNQTGSFRTNLYNNENNDAVLLDGIQAQFDNSYNSIVDLQDAPKLTNISENLAVVRDSKLLMVERRPVPIADDTLFLQLTGTSQKSYRFQFEPAALDASLTAFLEDSYTGKSTPLSVVNVSTFDFEITANIKSSDSTRFMIIFKTATGVLPVTYTAIKAYQQVNNNIVEWSVENEINISSYVVERSADGKGFAKLNTVKATSTNGDGSSYSYVDTNPLSSNNFYRIRSISKDGRFEYSLVVLVKRENLVSGISVYPNPVTGGVINMEFKNMWPGIYNVRLFNSRGQIMLTKTIPHLQNISTEIIRPGYKLVPGIYQLELTAPDRKITAVKMMVE